MLISKFIFKNLPIIIEFDYDIDFTKAEPEAFPVWNKIMLQEYDITFLFQEDDKDLIEALDEQVELGNYEDTYTGN